MCSHHVLVILPTPTKMTQQKTRNKPNTGVLGGVQNVMFYGVLLVDVSFFPSLSLASGEVDFGG